MKNKVAFHTVNRTLIFSPNTRNLHNLTRLFSGRPKFEEREILTLIIFVMTYSVVKQQLAATSEAVMGVKHMRLHFLNLGVKEREPSPLAGRLIFPPTVYGRRTHYI